MKTLTKILFAAVLGGAFSAAAIAGPGPQYWNRSSATPAPKAAKPANDGSVVTCDHMLIRNSGPDADRVPFVSVSCSPELMRTNEQCRNECGVAAPAKPEPTELTCAHMLIRTPGPGRSGYQWKSVTCTPEMMKTSLECQSACRRAS
jgi:hypothetical protein